MKKRKPMISVVMPVYNAGEFLVAAIESILKQTYKDFEFIIVDGGSKDNCWNIIKRYAKRYKKIKAYRNKSQIGLSKTVKQAISHAKGQFIARMDADDIALPKRLEKQIVYLLENTNTVAIGAQCFVINKKGRIMGEKTFPTSFDEIYKYIFKFIPIQQPTLMIAKDRLPVNFEFYRDGMNTAEEVELLFKLFQYGKVENLPDFLLKYRIHDNNTSLKNVKKTFLLTLFSRFKAIIVYDYRPTIDGVIVTLLEIPFVLLLPQKIVFRLYDWIRKILISLPLRLNLHGLRNILPTSSS